MATTAAPVRTGGKIGWLVGLIALSVLLNYVDRGAIGVAAPLMKAELGLSATEFGFAVSAFFWIYAPMCLLVGWLCDRFCVYRVFGAGVALWSLSTFLTGWVGGLASLIVLRLFLGLGEAIAFPGSSKIFAAEVPAHRRGMANAAVGAAIAFGPAVGTLAGGSILELGGWRPVFWVFGALTILWLIPWHGTSRPFRSAALATPVTQSVTLARLMRLPTLWIMGAAHFMSNYGFYFLLAWLPLFLTGTRGFSIPEMTAMTTAGFVAQGVAALAGGRWSDAQVAAGADEGRLRRRMMVVSHAALALAVTGVFLASSAPAITASLVLAGLAIGQISVNIFAVAQIFAGPRASGGWVGVQNTLGNISGIVGPIATGILVDRLGGYGWAFALAAAVAVAGTLLWAFAVPDIREVELTS